MPKVSKVLVTLIQNSTVNANSTRIRYDSINMQGNRYFVLCDVIFKTRSYSKLTLTGRLCAGVYSKQFTKYLLSSTQYTSGAFYTSNDVLELQIFEKTPLISTGGYCRNVSKHLYEQDKSILFFRDLDSHILVCCMLT